MRSLAVAAALIAAFPLSVSAPAPAAAPAAFPAVSVPVIPEPLDAPWPGGTMTLDIDASDTQRGIFRVVQTVPLAPGTRRLTLLYPQWLPGNHGPRGPIAELVDLRFSAGGLPVPWKRDPLEVHAFHLDLPAGATEVVARFIHTSPLQPSEGRITMTPEMLNLQWEKMSLYPAGHFVRRIPVKAAVTLPPGWTAATALAGRRQTGNRVTWDRTDYETLVDSPIFAGQHFRRWELGRGNGFNVVADSPDLLDLKERNLASIIALFDEAEATFGPPPYDRYEFLVALSSRMSDIGLEHLASSENVLLPANFIDWAGYDWDRTVLAHELAHAWNGKYRRPARIWTPDYRKPMQDDLLWVYEGQTEFWGWIHAVRSGLQAKETVLGMIASDAGYLAEQPGRAWRALEDTTHEPLFSARKPKPFPSLARQNDYYDEGALVWLEIDQIIRAGTGGRKGIDDFARGFYAHPGDGSRVKTFERADIVSALNAVHAHDWDGFLRNRIETPGQAAPLAGLEMGGYRLVWKEVPNPFDKARMDYYRRLSLYHSLGVSLDRNGEVEGTRWNSPAFNAGIVSGARIVAVSGIAYSPEQMKKAITAAKGGQKPIELLVQRGDRFMVVPVSYSGGLRWPWLERAPGLVQAPLDRLLAPRRGTMSQ